MAVAHNLNLEKKIMLCHKSAKVSILSVIIYIYNNMAQEVQEWNAMKQISQVTQPRFLEKIAVFCRTWYFQGHC